MLKLSMSLRTKLVIIFVLILSPVLLLLIANYREGYERQKKAVIQEQMRIAQLLSATVDDAFDEALSLAQSYAAFSSVISRDAAPLTDQLKVLPPIYPEYFDVISVFDADGDLVASALGPRPLNVADRDWFNHVMSKGEPTISGVLLTRVGSQPIVTAAAPIILDGQKAGAVSTSLRLHHFSNVLTPVQRVPDQDIFLADLTGRLAFHTGKADLAWDERDVASFLPVRAILEGERFSGETIESSLGDQRIVVTVATPKYGWIVGVSTPVEVAFSPLWNELMFSLAVFAGVLILSFASALFLSELLLRPLIMLKNAAVVLGRGEVNEPLLISSGDELEDLASAFNKMAERIRNREEQRARVLELLEKSEEHFRSVVETAKQAVVTADSHGNVVFWNKAADRFFGYSADEMIGRPIVEVIPERFRQEWWSRFYLDASTGELDNDSHPVELFGLRRNGSEFPAELSLASWEVSDGRYLTCIVRDITTRKQAEDVFRTMYHNSPVGVYIVQKGKFVFVNPILMKQAGYGEEELLGTHSLSFVLPEDRAVTRINAVRMLKGELSSAYEFRVTTKAGEVQWMVETVTSTVYQGEKAVLGQLMDITQRKRAEDALSQSEEQYRRIVETAEEGIWMSDFDGRVTFVNHKMASLLGYAVDEMMGKTLDDFIDQDARSIVLRKLEQRRGGVTDQYDLMFRRRDGGHLWAIVSTSPIHNAEGVYSGALAMVTDITDRKRAEQALEETVDKLRRVIEGTIQAMALIVETRDPYTAGHQQRVARLAGALAREMALPEDLVNAVQLAALIHDIGKISVPAEILSKPGRINEYEYSLIKAHARLAYDILKTVPFPWPIAGIVFQHHEMMDGSGYPSGLKGDEILLEARILAVADVVEAMASHRPYRPARGIKEALEEVVRHRGIRFDPEVVDACVRLFAEGRVELGQELKREAS